MLTSKSYSSDKSWHDLEMTALEPGDAFRIVRAGYDRLGERYRSWSVDVSVRFRQLKVVLERVPAGGVVVELGCGDGEPVTRLLSEHYRVVAVDASVVQLSMGRRAVPRAMFVLADMTELQFKPGAVDAVVSFYALGHVPARRHAALFRSIAQWLRPGGLVMASAPTGVGDAVEASWLGVPMFFGGIGEAATRAAVHQAGLTLERGEVITEDEGDGETAEFLWLTAVKPPVS